MMPALAKSSCVAHDISASAASRIGSLYVSAQERAASAVAAFVIVLLIVIALIFGLRVGQVARNPGALISVLFEPEKPPEPKRPRPAARRANRPAARRAPSPRNQHNKSTPVVAPPVAPLIVPPPIVVATQAGTGLAAANGASNRPGPGQGAGGLGNGTGGGGSGGDGEGDAVVGPRQIRGKLSYSDLPDGLLAPGEERRVGVRYTVEIDGTVSGCRADEPSGLPALDALACRLIEQRFRFRPARDAHGHPVRATIVEAHTWIVRDDDERSHG
jgi:protein TonB